MKPERLQGGHMYKVLLMSMAMGISQIASAAEEPCAIGSHNQADINQCSVQRYKAADALLNRTYREVIATLNKKQIAKLKDAQRAWITYRDANCESQAFDYLNGSLYTSVQTNCLAVMTEARTSELQRVYLKQDIAENTLPDDALIGTWRSQEGNYGLEITFGVAAGVHHYSSKINDVPFEAGQWQLNNNQLSIIDSRGKLLHQYNQVVLDDKGGLSLYETDGGVERFMKIQ
jgi:uncharacterized protein YecT (DUF1311 family)